MTLDNNPVPLIREPGPDALDPNERDLGKTGKWDSPAALRISEIRYRRLFEAARDGILIVDAETRKISDANPFMSELLGYPHHQLLGKELWEIGLLKDEAASRDAFRILQEKRFIRYEDLPLQTQSGHRREVEFVSNVYDEDGRTVVQCNIRDITARKRTETALRQAKAQLASHAENLERVVSERTAALRETIGELEGFSYSISHDLRAPVRAMQGFAHILLEEHAEQLDPTGRDYLGRIARSAVRLDALIADVLNYTRLLHTAVPLGRVELDHLLPDLVQSYPDWQPPKVDLQIQGPLPAILGHPGFLTQCISNLLSNAVKFVAPGTCPRVRIWAESAGTRMRLCFQDNGIGIAPENHGRIFRMFERIHLARDYDGTGVGLTIARKAVERMGGQVGFESQLGNGSRFWIELPLAPAPPNAPASTP
jgi:PAS domain S-box-containing protein